MTKDLGGIPGSHALHETPSGFRPTGFDPGREETYEVLLDCHKYLTEFGSVEPSQLVRRINLALANMRRERDEHCYLWQLETINAARIKEGKPALTYTEFLAGGEG